MPAIISLKQVLVNAPPELKAHWHNHDRLHGYLDDVPPAEFEETFYAQSRTDQSLVEIQ